MMMILYAFNLLMFAWNVAKYIAPNSRFVIFVSATSRNKLDFIVKIIRLIKYCLLQQYFVGNCKRLYDGKYLMTHVLEGKIVKMVVNVSIATRETCAKDHRRADRNYLALESYYFER